MADRWPNRAAVPSLGKLPECAGHYEAGHAQCDDGPCSWRAGCQIYRVWAEARADGFGIEADQYLEGERQTLPRKARALMIRELMRARPATYPKHFPRHLKGWERFLNTFNDTNPGVPVMPSERTAQDGELYVRAKHNKAARGPVEYDLRIRGAKKRHIELAIFRYTLGIKSRVEPNIQIMITVRDLFARFPRLERAASRWRGCAKGGGPAWRKRARLNLGATAVAVYSERIEDFGRACAHLLKEGLMPGLTVHNRRVLWTEEAMNWRP